MKKILALSLLFITAISIKAQNSNAILFTENGERFKVVLNGILQNTNAETNVKLTELAAPQYKCRILFEDAKLGYTDFNMIFPNPGYEVTWNIKKNNKGEYVVRYVSDVLLTQAPVTTPEQKTVIFKSKPAVTSTTTTIQQTQTTGTSGDDVSINMGMSTYGEGGNVSIQASGVDGANGNTSTTTTTTTTTTHTVISGSTAEPEPYNDAGFVPGYNGKIGCPSPINSSEFSEMKESIRSKDFENTKLTIAKQILQNNCLTSSQVRELLGLFDFENTKLDFAKFAYDRTYDIGNYYKVNDAFEFESSVDDLNKYISTHRN